MSNIAIVNVCYSAYLTDVKHVSLFVCYRETHLATHIAQWGSFKTFPNVHFTFL